MARADAATGLKPAYSFDQLVVGSNNNVAVAACREVLKAPGEQYNPLFIFGPVGVGKTHLIQSVANEMVRKDAKLKVKYISAERFMNEIVTAISEDRILDVRRVYSELDLLIVDDVQYLTDSKIAQEELFHIFNNMHQEGRQAILAADRPPTHLTNLSQGIKSRLEWGLSTDIKVPDEATRLEILRRKQQMQGLSIPDEMLQVVAASLHSNVRELEGFLKRMHAYVMLSHQEISMDLVKTVIRELIPHGTGPVDPSSPFIPPDETLAPPPVAKEISSDMKSAANGHGKGHANGHGKHDP
jgi:chromosomal replication initiator protein